MKITALETLHARRSFRSCSGCGSTPMPASIGTGESFWAPGPIVAYRSRSTSRSYLLGKDPRDIALHDRRLGSVYVGARDSGAEVRGNSAVNIALWDIYGQALGEPLWRLLGGRAQDERAGLQHLRRLRPRPRHQAATRSSSAPRTGP